MPVKRVYSRKPVKTVRKKPANVKKIVKSVVNSMVETKEHNLTFNDLGLNSIGNGGTSSLVAYGMLASISQGVGEGQRIGSIIQLRGLRFYFPISNGDFNNRVRFIIASPKRDYPLTASNNALFSDLFGQATWNMYNPINTEKWRVHRDTFMYLTNSPNDGNSASNHPSVKLIKGFIKINKKVAFEYDALAGAIRPTTELYVFAVSDSAAVPNPGAIGGFARLFFKDA